MNMIVNTNTKIVTLLKQSPGALEAIISINPKFEKLRNPLLRKLMAARTSIAMACKISGNKPEEFYAKLVPLGFVIDQDSEADKTDERPPLPAFFTAIKPEDVIELDVRPIIDAGNDPLRLITEKVKALPDHGVLKIINSFEPTPLILLLKKQGFDYYSDMINDQLTETYFYKKEGAEISLDETTHTTDWDHCMQKFSDKMQTIDVRNLEMPKPMLTILDALDHLPSETALFVYHKRIPVFLLPELKERKFDYRIKEVSDGLVHLLIFKD
ncbi:MAG: DUF2249 domain-containing protein [Ginsengibacter sp.]